MKEDYSISYPPKRESFSSEHLNQYLQRTSWKQADLIKLKHIDTLTKKWLQERIKVDLTDRDYYLIKEHGLSAGALLIKELDWEVVAIISNDSSFNYFDEIINLCAESKFTDALTLEEKEALKIIMSLINHPNTFTSNQLYQSCLDNLQIKSDYS